MCRVNHEQTYDKRKNVVGLLFKMQLVPRVSSSYATKLLCRANWSQRTAKS